MQAFVTGAAGFIGSHLVDALIQKGWRVRALIHRTPLAQVKGVELVTGDIGDRRVLAAAFDGVDVAFHLASVLGSAVVSQEEFRRINVEGTAAMLEEARSKGSVRFIHVSSAGVLGSVPSGEAVDETFPPRPLSIYDRTKLEAEKMALDAASSGMDVVIIRPGWAYGPRDRRTLKLIRAVARKKLPFLPRGRAKQTPVYVDDLIAGILLAARFGQRGHVYHIAGEEILEATEIVAAIGRACSVRVHPFPVPIFLALLAARGLEAVSAPFKKEPPLNRAKLSFFIHSKPLSIKKARAELGFRPRVDFRHGLDLTIAWYRNAGWL